ncbi:hypothetical protein ACWGB8_12800 [Kitasatospora sp. NPDC054939]
MTIPGFHAEASLHRYTGGYATGRHPAPTRARTAGDRIVPMLTEEELELIRTCDRRWTGCQEGCEPLRENYDAWQPCNAACNHDYNICMHPETSG